MISTCSQIEQIIPQLILTIKQVLEDPSNKEAKDRLFKLMSVASDYSAKLASLNPSSRSISSNGSALDALMRKMEHVTNKLVQANEVERLAKKLQSGIAKQIDFTRSVVNGQNKVMSHSSL